MIATRFYLDTRRCKEGTAAPLKISIYWKREVAYLSTGIKILPKDWDAKAQAAKDRTTQHTIARIKLKVDSKLSDLQDEHRLDGLNAMEIKDRLEKELSPEAEERRRLLACMEEFAASRPQPRTTAIYRATIDRILAFDRNADLLNFEDIDVGWLDRFDSFLASTSPKKNARNIHLRNIRAVFNYALKNDITICYPFRKYEIRPEGTMKRALTAEELRTLFNADVKEWEQKYVDFFKISFLLIGMNTEDLIHATGISGGRMEYRRAKTHRPYSIKVEKECQEIIDKYRGKEYLLNVLDTYADTHNWTSKVNNELQKIASSLGLPKISMYWARHSWATIAAELEVPKDTIAAALGHSSNTVTDIYINFDRGKIDQANRKVLDFVLYDKKPADVFDILRQLNEKVQKMG